MAQPAVKTRPKSRPDKFNGAPLIPGNPGNSGGKKGRSGRKPELFFEKAKELANDPTVWNVQMARAKSGDLKALEFAAHYSYGKPKDTVAHEGQVTIKVEYDE